MMWKLTQKRFLVLSYPTLRIFTDLHLSLSDHFLGAKFENYRILVARDIFVIWKPIPKHVCFHIKMSLLTIEIKGQGMMVKIHTNFYQFFIRNPLKRLRSTFYMSELANMREIQILYHALYMLAPMCTICTVYHEEFRIQIIQNNHNTLNIIKNLY